MGVKHGGRNHFQTNMKLIDVVTYAGFVLMVGGTIHAQEKSQSRNENVGSTNPFRQTFLSFSPPSLSILRNPFQGLTNPNKFLSVRTTKTEYVEVTRRQTVHPMCYTTYEPVAPCLSHRQDYYQEDRDVETETEATHPGLLDLDDGVKAIRPTTAVPVHMTRMPDILNAEDLREARYLEFKKKSFIERLDLPMVSMHFPRRGPSEIVTKTVLINKVERFTDHHVTATLLAVNCIPSDRNIPACHSRHDHPIKDAPDGFFEDRILSSKFESNK